jgi:hypothetical protein
MPKAQLCVNQIRHTAYRGGKGREWGMGTALNRSTNTWASYPAASSTGKLMEQPAAAWIFLNRFRWRAPRSVVVTCRTKTSKSVVATDKVVGEDQPAPQGFTLSGAEEGMVLVLGHVDPHNQVLA